jgi:hypothetical protein
MINLTANLGPVVNGLSAADAYLSLDKNFPYWNAVINYAFRQADNQFNKVAAASGASGAIKHMFEWGTLGINRGATNMRPGPLEERARLWEDYIIDKGPQGGVKVDFEYKPSVADVPIPTVVPMEIRQLMRKHQFKWKAEVLEEGRPVHITRQDAEFLLIPYKAGMTGFRPYDIKRGYTLTRHAIDTVPGKDIEGRFPALWTRFWSNTAPDILEASLDEQITSDFAIYFADTAGGRINKDIVEAVKIKSAKIQREVAAKAKSRQTRYDY